jgi:PilZ domain
MAILAELHPQRRTSERRAALRRTLQLTVRGETPAGGSAQVLIHDISVTGILLETSADLLIGETIEVDVPDGGPTTAIVMWNSGRFFGCQFHGRISPAAVSAAVLRSPFERTDDDLRTGAEEGPTNELSPMAKAWILIALVVTTWAIIFLLIERFG